MSATDAAGLPTARPALALPLAHRSDTVNRSPTPSARSHASTPSRADSSLPAWPGRPSRSRPPTPGRTTSRELFERVVAAHGRRPQHAPRGRRCSSTRSVAANAAADAGHETDGPTRSPRSVNVALWGDGTLVTRRRRRASTRPAKNSSTSATRPETRRTGPRPTACVTNWSTLGWVVEDGSSGTVIRRP